MTKTERVNLFHLVDAMRRLEWDMQSEVMRQQRIPAEWHDIARSRGGKAKVRVTTLVEEDVLRFFKSMGRGYQERMNQVLRAFMHGRLAGMVEGPETPLGVNEGPRPEWGGTERELEELAQREGGIL